jgi:hypothetical protein
MKRGGKVIKDEIAFKNGGVSEFRKTVIVGCFYTGLDVRGGTTR